MKLHSFPFAILLGALSSVSCGGTPPPATHGEPSCAAALQHLDSCVSTYCAGHADPVCDLLTTKTGNTLFDAKDPTCGEMSAAEIFGLQGADCDAIMDDARLLAAGKADFPCPSYFPWCNELTPKNALFHVNVLSSDATGASLEVLVGEVVRKTTIYNGKAFQALTLEGAGTLAQPGRPAVPTISFLVGLPSGTDAVQVDSMERGDERTVDNITLAPYVLPNTEDAPPEPFFVDDAFYQQEGRYPTDDYAVDKVSTWRNYRVVRVTVHPFLFHPSRRHLTASRRIALRLSFLDTKTEPKDTVDTGESDGSAAYSSAIVNYPETAGGGSVDDPPKHTRYLVIAHDPLVDAIQPLLDLKNQQGLATEVVKLSEVGADSQKIKARIQKAYQDSAIEYVLLVGDVDVIPMHTYELPWTSFYKTDIPGDYDYSLLAGDDLLPEVSIGRIAGKTPEEVAVHVAKTVAYQNGDPTESWRKKILLVAHEEQYPNKYTACAEEVRSHPYPTDSVDFIKLYGGEHASAADIVREVNGGVGVIGYRGHGSETAWMGWNGTDFSAGDAPLANGNRTPVVFSVACLNLSLQGDAISHGEQWVLKSGGGAVGFLGSTLRSWTSPNDVFMKHIFRALLEDGASTVGQVINRARAEMIKQYAADDSGPDNAMMYLWLGDPSMRIGDGFRKRPQAAVGWCSALAPSSLAVSAGSVSEKVTGQVWARGVTEAIGKGSDIEGALGFGPVGTQPTDASWTWVSAAYVADKGNNDEYHATLRPAEPGTYSYAFRFKGAHDASWTVCDLDGNQNGFDPSQLGTLTVQ